MGWEGFGGGDGCGGVCGGVLWWWCGKYPGHIVLGWLLLEAHRLCVCRLNAATSRNDLVEYIGGL